MKGIIDRFEGELAVILVETENREILIPIKELPDECTIKSAVNIDQLVRKTNPAITLDDELDEEKKQKSSNLRKSLLSRKKNSKLKKRK